VDRDSSPLLPEELPEKRLTAPLLSRAEEKGEEEEESAGCSCSIAALPMSTAPELKLRGGESSEEAAAGRTSESLRGCCCSSPPDTMSS
jgi:hypothetical protein